MTATLNGTTTTPFYLSGFTPYVKTTKTPLPGLRICFGKYHTACLSGDAAAFFAGYRVQYLYNATTNQIALLRVEDGSGYKVTENTRQITTQTFLNSIGVTQSDLNNAVLEGQIVGDALVFTLPTQK